MSLIIAYAKTKTQISCAVTAQLISAFVFAIWIVQTLFYQNPKFQASSHLLWLYSPVCVGPGRKPRRPVFSQRGSYLSGADKADQSCIDDKGTQPKLRHNRSEIALPSSLCLVLLSSNLLSFFNIALYSMYTHLNFGVLKL